MIRAREGEAGARFGDGPTSEQVSALIVALEPISDLPDSVMPSVLWHAYRNLTEVEMSWLFPEHDPLGAGMIAALREIQQIIEESLAKADPSMDLVKYRNLNIIANAARKRQKVHGNKMMWRLVLARAMHWLGGGKS